MTNSQITPWWAKLWLRPRRRLALSGLTALLATCLLAGPVQAFGGGIEVLKDSRETDFPGDLNFTLTAQGDVEIVEVQLLYRIVGSNIWSYAYADFSPGQQVNTNITLAVGRPTYLPPGTELEYYYVISDAQGNLHRTEIKLVEYADRRFQWDRTQIGRLVLLHHGLSQSRVRAVSKEVEDGLNHLTNLLQLKVSQPIKGIIYNSGAEARPAFPRQSETITEAQVFGGFAFSSSGVFVGVGFSPRIIVHESAHLLFTQALGPDALPVPAWLNEGFASYVEPGSTAYSGRSLSSRSLPLRAMSRVSGTPDTIGTFYRKAESVVAYLIEDFGVESFQRFLEELAQGRMTEEALFRTYGFGVSGLDSRWASDDQRPPAPAPGSPFRGSPWVNFSSLVMGALAVTVFIAMVLRYIVRRLRPTERPEDRLQPWEDPDLIDPYDDP